MKRTRKVWLVSGAPPARQASVPVVVVGGEISTWGRDCQRAHSALTSPAVRRSRGRWSSSSFSVRGLRGVDGDVHGGADRAGAVADRGRHRADAGRQLLVGQRPAAGPDLGQLVAELLARSCRCSGGSPAAARLGEGRVQLVGGQRGEQHLALRGLRRREAGADVDPQRDDLRHRHPGDVDDVGAVELRHRGRLAGLRRPAPRGAAGRCPTAPARRRTPCPSVSTFGVSEKAAADRADEAQLLQGQQQPARGRAGQPGRGRHLGQRHRSVDCVEAGEHVQPASQ